MSQYHTVSTCLPFSVIDGLGINGVLPMSLWSLMNHGRFRAKRECREMKRVSNGHSFHMPFGMTAFAEVFLAGGCYFTSSKASRT